MQLQLVPERIAAARHSLTTMSPRRQTTTITERQARTSVRWTGPHGITLLERTRARCFVPQTMPPSWRHSERPHAARLLRSRCWRRAGRRCRMTLWSTRSKKSCATCAPAGSGRPIGSRLPFRTDPKRPQRYSVPSQPPRAHPSRPICRRPNSRTSSRRSGFVPSWCSAATKPRRVPPRRRAGFPSSRSTPVRPPGRSPARACHLVMRRPDARPTRTRPCCCSPRARRVPRSSSRSPNAIC